MTGRSSTFVTALYDFGEGIKKSDQLNMQLLKLFRVSHSYKLHRVSKRCHHLFYMQHQLCKPQLKIIK